MMKFLVIAVTIFLGANAALDSDYVEKIIQEIVEVGQKCAEENKATVDDVAEIHAHKFPPSTHEAKCTIACFYKSYNMMTNSGTFDKSAVISAFEPIKKMDENVFGKIVKVADACENSEIVADQCETASMMAACALNESKKIGLAPEDFLPAKKS